MEHLTHEALAGYGDGTLAANGLLAADRHLAECAVCRHKLRRTVAAPALPALVLEMEEPAHLTYEQMSWYLEAGLDEAGRGRIEDHMHLCRSCAEEVRSLQVFDARMAMEFETVPVTEAVEARESWFEKLRENIAEFVRQFWATPQRVRLAGAGVGLMLLGIVSLVKVQATNGVLRDGSPAAAHVTMLSMAAHPHLFYGGFLILGGGMVALLYGLFKR